MSTEIQIVRCKGQALIPYLDRLAELRIAVFKEYPYLYLGNFEYEANYLKTYAACPESVMVLAFSNNQIVGASTAIPLTFETDDCKKPFIEHGMDLSTIFYLGESVLLPAYRGKNIYRHFFAEREAAAREYGCTMTAFCAVKRSADDARRPKDYKPLDAVWQHFGYQKREDLCVYYEWQEIGEATSTKKPLIFWTKYL